MSDSDQPTQPVRAFVAVPIPADTRARVAAVQQRLRADGVKWVEPTNYHFTLRFLGNTAAPTLAALRAALSEALAECQAFPLTLRGVGAFPNRQRPRTIWIGVGEGRQELEALAATVERVVVAVGCAPEPRPFRPHLTLGRVKAERPLPELTRALEREPADQEVERMERRRSC